MSTYSPISSQNHGQSGFTLVELMISLVIGLLVIAAAGSLFLSNRRVYASTESVNRIQENQRTAYELMSRDIREAGGNPCSRNVVNMLDTSKPGGAYFNTWMQGISGVNGASGGTDELTLSLANAGSVSVTSNDGPSANIGISAAAGFVTDDIVMVCNPEVAAIFQITAIPGGVSLQHNSGNGNPGNLQKPFQSDQDTFDSNPSGNAAGYCYLPDPVSPNPNCLNRASNLPAQVVRPYAVRWYVASNPRGGSSLYRQTITNAVAAGGQEIAEGVTNLQVQYRMGASNNFQDASTGWTSAQWATVNAVSIVLTVQATTGSLNNNDVRGTNNAVLTRVFSDVVALRNRMEIQ